MATTTNYGWTTPDDTDLVKDGAAAIRTLGSSADTTVKNLSPGTTAGDLDYYTSGTAKARLAIGTAGQVLAVNSGATAPEWVPSGSGKVLQVVQATYSTATATSTAGSWVDTGLSASITPTSATSTILIMTTQMIGQTGNLNDRGWNVQLLRASTAIFPSSGSYNTYLSITSIGDIRTTHSLHYIDSPATTSATTYKTQMMNQTGRTAVTTTAQDTTQTSSMILMEIGA